MYKNNIIEQMIEHKMDCIKCRQNLSTVFLACGHPICTKCFEFDIECLICTL